MLVLITGVPSNTRRQHADDGTHAEHRQVRERPAYWYAEVWLSRGTTIAARVLAAMEHTPSWVESNGGADYGDVSTMMA